MTMFTTTIRKVGDTYEAVIPVAEIERLGLAEGDMVMVNVTLPESDPISDPPQDGPESSRES